MKKMFVIMAIVLLVIFSNWLVFADNAKRIDDLQKEGQQLSQRKQEYVQALQNIDARLQQIVGGIQVLQELDKTAQPKIEEIK